MEIEQQRGIRFAGTPIATAAPATALVLYTLRSASACIIRKIMWYNAAGVDTLMTIGTGLAGLFAAALTPINTINGQTGVMGELECPGVLFQANITFMSVLAGVTCQVEVEEIA